VHYVIVVSKDDSLPRRRSIRLAHYDYSQAGAYFVTICTEHRKCAFGAVPDERMVCNSLGLLVGQCLLNIPMHFPNAALDEFVFMPNHIHAIIFLADNAPQYALGNSVFHHVGAQHAAPARVPRVVSRSLSAIVRSFKSAVTKQAHEKDPFTGGALWQRNYYEHVIRNERDLLEKRQYIANNPLKWVLDEYYIAQ
jgi:putative transposase